MHTVSSKTSLNKLFVSYLKWYQIEYSISYFLCYYDNYLKVIIMCDKLAFFDTTIRLIGRNEFQLTNWHFCNRLPLKYLIHNKILFKIKSSYYMYFWLKIILNIKSFKLFVSLDYFLCVFKFEPVSTATAQHKTRQEEKYASVFINTYWIPSTIFTNYKNLF